MKWILVVVIAVLVLPSQGLAQKLDYKDTKSREWTDRSGQHDVIAKLVSFDKENDQVFLQREDETTIEMSATDLSISDRRYIARQTSKLKREAKRASHVRQAATDKIDVQTEQNLSGPGLDTRRPPDFRKTTAEGVQRLYEIDWHQQLDSAQSAALGKEGLSDDKPIMWFRVLGDLSGYM